VSDNIEMFPIILYQVGDNIKIYLNVFLDEDNIKIHANVLQEGMVNFKCILKCDSSAWIILKCFPNYY
jgi:hypothetical protein